jgi:hypothetical protein
MLSGYIKTLTMDFVQTFEKGMVQDFADQPSGTFYEASAFHLISKSGNTFALESALGNTLVFSVTKGYTPIGAAGVVDKIVVFSARSDGQSEISLVTVSNQQTCTCVPLYNDKLGFSVNFPIESLLFPENEFIERTYWTDRTTSPKVLNILDERLHIPFLQATILPLGKYMVVQGIVVFNGISYGPSQASTVFEVTGITPTFFTIVGLGTYKVIEYIDKDGLDWTAPVLLGNLRLNRPIAGSAKNGIYVACFQLLTEDGASTAWSMPCFPIRVAGPAAVGNISTYQKHEGHFSTVLSNQGFELLIENIDQKYSRIRVAVVHGTDYGVYGNPVIIYDSTVSGVDMIIPYTGSEMIQELVEEDLLQFFKKIRKVGTLAVVNNIMFPGNIEYGKDVKWDPSTGVSAKCIKYDLFHDMRNVSWDGSSVGHAGVSNPIAATGSNLIRMKQWYRVKTGIINYLGTNYSVGQMFQGESLSINSSAETFTTPNNGTLEAVIRIKKYDFGGGNKYQITPIDNDFYDGKGMMASHYLKSYWRGERYRWTLALIDTSGNIGYARWLTDKEIPEQHKNAGDLDDLGNAIGFDARLFPLEYGAVSNPNPSSPNPRYCIRHIGIEINGIDFNALLSELGLTSFAQLKEHFSGFTILRCPRDAKIIAQGSIYPITKKGFSVPGGYSQYGGPMAVRKMSQDNDGKNGGSGQIQDFYNFYSPDFQFRWNSNPSLSAASNVKVVGIYDYAGADYGMAPIDIAGNPVAPIVAVDKNIQYYSSVGGFQPAGTKIDIDAAKCAEEIEFAASGGVGNSDVWFDNGAVNVEAHAFDPYPYSQSDLTGTIPPAYGCRSTILNIRSIEPFPLNPGSIARQVINICNTKTSFYGGNGAAAKANNQSISVNHYQSFDDDFISMLNSTSGICNGIEIFGGDATIGLYTVNRVVRGTCNEHNHVVIFPIESNCNFLLRNGRHTNKVGASQLINYDPEVYSLNHAFSNNYLLAPVTGIPDRYKPVSRFPYRGLFSMQKIAGEEIDGFRKFQLAAFRDVSGLNGTITNFRAKGMKLFYWQKRAVGYIPVNERAIVNTSIGSPTVIGQGGVMERYDERTNYFGNQHQFGLIDTPDGFVWIDAERKVLCMMSTGLEIVELDVAKGMNSFFQKNLSGDIFINDRPTAGKGISGFYDPQYNRVVLSVMGTDTDFTILFDQQNGTFTGLMPYKAGLFHVFQNMVFAMSPQNKYYVPVSSQMVPVGAIVEEFGIVYVCILAYSYSGTGYALNPLHWSPIYSMSDSFQQNIGDIGKWFGLVYPSSLKYIVNGENLNEPKVFDNSVWRASKEFFDSLIAETVDQIAVDINLSNKKDYEYRNKMWSGSLPLANDGRLIGNTLKINLLKFNKLNGSPITSSNEKIILNTAMTVFRTRY